MGSMSQETGTLTLGPGGLRFGDFWRMGVLLEIIVVVTNIPVLMGKTIGPLEDHWGRTYVTI